MLADSFLALLYRYWFFGWLFRDAQRGSPHARIAALRHNRARAVWLPTYIRRWLVLGALLYGAGVLTEAAGYERMAPTVFVLACLTVPVTVLGTASWVLLRGRPGP